MLPASMSPKTVSNNPTMPTAMATMVDVERRSPRKRVNTTATNGVSEPRKAALAAVVVSTV